MKSARVNDVKLDYEIEGSGEPVLLISPVLADGFLPFFSEPGLAGHYRLIRYHRRGWAGSTHTAPPVSTADHAADAASLLAHLGIERAHVVGHSSGAAVALQLALDRSELVHSLSVLEPTLLTVPAAKAFLEKVGPALGAYEAGEHEKAVALFLSAVSGLDWPTCRAVLEQHAPGAVAQTIRDADTFFGIELPALGTWTFGREQAARIAQPVLSLTAAGTEPLWVEIAGFVRDSFPRVEEREIAGIGHLMHLQSPGPVAAALAEFLARHPMAGAGFTTDEAHAVSSRP